MSKFLSLLRFQSTTFSGRLKIIPASIKKWLCAGIIISLTPPVYAESASETALKTAFLYNFFRFINWPEPHSHSATLNLCTSENEKLGDRLSVLANKVLADKTIVLRRNIDKQDMLDCQMVYIDPSDNIPAILKQLNNLPIVTVSETPDFIHQGGTIGLIQTQRLSFELNLDQARNNYIHISAQLTKLAKYVKVSN